MESINNHRRGKQSRSRVHAKSTIRNKRRWSQKHAWRQAIAHIRDTHRGDLEYRPTGRQEQSQGCRQAHQPQSSKEDCGTQAELKCAPGAWPESVVVIPGEAPQGC